MEVTQLKGGRDGSVHKRPVGCFEKATSISHTFMQLNRHNLMQKNEHIFPYLPGRGESLVMEGWWEGVTVST